MSDGYESVHLPASKKAGPLRALLARFAFAGLLVFVNWLLVVLEREDYTDSRDGEVSLTDALYYTTVTLSTTGYGDITPVSDSARMINALVVTPLRLMFLAILVGTTLQALTERSRTEFRLARWRARMRDHVVVLGYGTKGRNALRALRMRDHAPDHLVVVEADPQIAAQASADGYVVITGNATSPDVLQQALVHRAHTVIVALDRDDTAILATLTLRRIAPRATVVASAREAQHAVLLQEGGASSVVVSSETTGRLLGLATESADAVGVVEDLLSFGQGLDLSQRPVRPEEVGRPTSELGVPVLAVVRAGLMIRYNEAGAGRLQAGDRIVFVDAPEPGLGPHSGAHTGHNLY
ncbi:voltage-gated potassium channel [Kineococcus xinjiangensis]|uniref:Voltage-gated potassium channel n=1 Tax=Kineococcus xinjiangensis TaxID=512762 RepID=A0A2S6IVB2_9ACTN|nr:potassium channel family protein [Kineococcus xinjiangensis]PPK98201.1 voltage-gated potassium channel [Kineococcus xinjiangensis]